MKRNGFTMVELIFVIIIIGILGAAAIPKFGDIKDRAKVNAEYNNLSGLDGSIIAAMEFQEDGNASKVDWHETPWGSMTNLTDYYTAVNSSNNVLSKILKNNKNLRIVAYADAGNPVNQYEGYQVDDIIFIEGQASNTFQGTKELDTDTFLNGKPDKTDVWAFNASAYDANVSYMVGTNIHTKILEPGDLSLIEVDYKVVFRPSAVTSSGHVAVQASTPSNTNLHYLTITSVN